MPFSSTFSKLTDTEREAMLDGAETRTHALGERIIKQGQPHNALYVVTKGKVQVLHTVPVKKMTLSKTDAATIPPIPDEAKEKAVNGTMDISIATLGEGAMFGEMSLIEDNITSANVVANSDVETLCITSEMVDALIEKDPSFAGRFYHSLAITLSRRLRRSSRALRKD